MISKFKSDYQKRTKNAKRSSLESPIKIGLDDKSYGIASRTKRENAKILESIAEKLNIGELTKFYKLRKPNKEDLNIIQMVLILVSNKLSKQLAEIGLVNQATFDDLHWTDVQKFLESQASKIIKILKSIAGKVYSKKIETIIDILSIFHRNKIEYKDKFTPDLIRDYIVALDKSYVNYQKKIVKNKDGIQRAPDNYANINQKNDEIHIDRMSESDMKDLNDEFPEKLPENLVSKSAIGPQNYKYDHTPVKPNEAIKELTPRRPPHIVESSEKPLSSIETSEEFIRQKKQIPQSQKREIKRKVASLANRTSSRRYEATTASWNRRMPNSQLNKSITPNETTPSRNKEVKKAYVLFINRANFYFRNSRPLSKNNKYDMVKNQKAVQEKTIVQDKWLADSAWIKKMQNNHRAQYNHYNLSHHTKATIMHIKDLNKDHSKKGIKIKQKRNEQVKDKSGKIDLQVTPINNFYSKIREDKSPSTSPVRTPKFN